MVPVLALALGLKIGLAQERLASSEEVKTRPDKGEILELMSKVKRMPISEQQTRLDAILKQGSAGKQPRSDFLLCIGLAYWGNYQAQMCTGIAYESGRGIVEDLAEAYSWYSIAEQSAVSDEEAARQASTAKERVKSKLMSTYPAPTDEELEDLVKEQKHKIVQYQNEAKS